MAIMQDLVRRSGGRCELCGATDGLAVHDTGKPGAAGGADSGVLLCPVCTAQMDEPANGDVNHWRCLADSMWSEFPAVQVLAYRILRRMPDVVWAQDLLGQLYLDDELQAWADAGLNASAEAAEDEDAPTLDSNGTPLKDGDTVTLIKDLDVKGANFTAKRGTTVKNIVLTGDPKYVEGRIGGSVIVLVAAYLKKA